MNLKRLDKAIVKPFLDRLQAAYTAMDREYDKAAACYGFNCSECRDNCCQSRFHHHTYIEYLFVLEGLKTLIPAKQNEIISKAMAACRGSAQANQAGKPLRRMCSLNFDNLCILYPYRPMICRLHGIPHELQKTSQNRVYGAGCSTFDKKCSGKGYFKFDRTPFYMEMATLEMEFKQAAGINGKIKMTIAEMLISSASGMQHGA